MSTTTAAMLLAIVDRRARELSSSPDPISLVQWETFDHTVYRCLHTLLGPGRRLTGHDAAAAAAAIRAFAEYPAPLKPMTGELLTPAEAARLLGVTPYAVRWRIESGHLPARRMDRDYRIVSDDLDNRPDLVPADPNDTHPLARVTVALGAMSDAVVGHRASRGIGLTDDTEIAAAMRQVLALTAVAARHTLGRCPIAEADRPLAVAQYATRAVDTLEARTHYPQLWAITSSTSPAPPVSANDRLEAALRQWNAASLAHLKYPVPSTDVLRNIANEGVHILATTEALITGGAVGDLSTPFTASGGHSLREVASSLRAADLAWAPFTTAMPPSHDYVTASRAAFSALTEFRSLTRTPDSEGPPVGEIDRARALLDLAVAMRDVISHLNTMDVLSRRLLDSQLLFVRARNVAPRVDLLEARSRGQLVVARPQDADGLTRATRAASELVRTVPDGLFTLLAEHSKSMAEPVVGEPVHQL